VERVFDRAAELSELPSEQPDYKRNISTYFVGMSGGVCDDNYELDF
jgi:hypothetical protein